METTQGIGGTTQEIGGTTQEIRETTQEIGGTTQEIGETTQEIGGTTQETNEKYSTKERIIRIIKNNNRVTRIELAEKIGVSENAIKQQIAKLKKDGVLERMGSTKKGHWEIRK